MHHDCDCSTPEPTGLSIEEFRVAKGWSYSELARRFGFSDAGYARRAAIGEYKTDAAQLEHYIALSGGEITIEAVHRQRLAWLRDHRPDLFAQESKN